ncbi:MAG: hypothetical protein AVDCRST_MAG93-4905, partial [uncultured Chloroflexia bacterium]
LRPVLPGDIAGLRPVACGRQCCPCRGAGGSGAAPAGALSRPVHLGGLVRNSTRSTV